MAEAVGSVQACDNCLSLPGHVVMEGDLSLGRAPAWVTERVGEELLAPESGSGPSRSCHPLVGPEAWRGFGGVSHPGAQHKALTQCFRGRTTSALTVGPRDITHCLPGPAASGRDTVPPARDRVSMEGCAGGQPRARHMPSLDVRWGQGLCQTFTFNKNKAI